MANIEARVRMILTDRHRPSVQAAPSSAMPREVSVRIGEDFTVYGTPEEVRAFLAAVDDAVVQVEAELADGEAA